MSYNINGGSGSVISKVFPLPYTNISVTIPVSVSNCAANGGKQISQTYIDKDSVEYTYGGGQSVGYQYIYTEYTYPDGDGPYSMSFSGQPTRTLVNS